MGLIPEEFEPQENLGFRYVAVCDVLGFSALIKSKPLMSLVREYSVFTLVAQDITNIHSNPSWNVEERTKFRLVQSTIFSDTIILYTIPVSPNESLLDIATVSCFFDVCGVLLSMNIGRGLPLRIGIAYGQMYVDKENSIYVGAPIVDAHGIETKQDWLGGACHTSCEKAPHFSRVSDKWLDVVRYDVPLHKGRESMWALNWPKEFVGRASEATRPIKKCIRNESDIKIRKKYEEAHGFFEWSDRHIFPVTRREMQKLEVALKTKSRPRESDSLCLRNLRKRNASE